MHVYACVSVCVRVNALPHKYAYACLCMYIYIYICVCVYVCVCVFERLSLYRYKHMHVHVCPCTTQTTKPTEASAVADPGTLPASGHMSIWAFVIGTLIVGCALTVVKVKFPSLLGMHASAQGYDRIDEV
jgi:hypothetical protein